LEVAETFTLHSQEPNDATTWWKVLKYDVFLCNGGVKHDKKREISTKNRQVKLPPCT
jgi:hypothetical protein